VILHGKASKDTRVSEIMTDKVLYVTPDRTVDECMAIMTEKHFRHLPVLDDEQKVLGIVSIGDVVKETICEAAVHHPANGKIHRGLRRRTCVRVVPVAQAGSRKSWVEPVDA
jgi:CBS-domain-containing membrane protein